MLTFERFHAIKIFQEASSRSKTLKSPNLRRNGCSTLMWWRKERRTKLLVKINLCLIIFSSEYKSMNTFFRLTWILIHQDLPIWILLHSISRHSINNSQRLIKCKYIYLFVVDFIWLLITFSFGCQSYVINCVFFILISCLWL